jgi:DNA-directed RNA polymerase I, II, and III subunit RPABC2
MSSAIPSLPSTKSNPELQNSENEEEDVGAVVVEENDISDDDDDDEVAGLSENDESGSQTTADADDDTGSEVDDDAVGGENSGGEDEAEGSDDDAAAAAGASGKQKKNKKKRSASKRDTEDDLTLLGVPHGIHFDEDNSDENEDDADEDRDSSEYFQKLSSNVRESYIETYHPESLSHNYDEIQTLSRVIRNAAGVIVDDLHRTIPIMTKYEKTRILGQRTKQLNEGAPAFIKMDSTVIDGYLIALKELEQKKTPFIIRRPLPNGGSEYWRIQDLEIL